MILHGICATGMAMMGKVVMRVYGYPSAAITRTRRIEDDEVVEASYAKRKKDDRSTTG